MRNAAAEVLNIDKLTYAGNLDAVAAIAADPRYGFRCLDICDGPALAAEFEAFKPDCVIHLAAESHVDRSIEAPAAFVRTNVLGTFSILSAALHYWQNIGAHDREHFRFVHVSTDEVFGALPFDSRRFTESSPYAPNSPYAATKAGADHLARAWHRTYQMPVIISNCCNNFGPFQFPEKLIPTIIVAALNGAPVPIYGNGSNIRDWIYVDDHVRALMAIVERGTPGATYLVSAETEISNLDLAKTLCRILDELAPPTYRPHEQFIQFVRDRPGHDLRYAVDPRRLHTEIGWVPSEEFDKVCAKQCSGI